MHRRLSMVRPGLIVFVVALSLVSACKKDSPSGPSGSTTTTTTTSVAPTTATLTVVIEGTCNNRGGINVFIDGTSVGTISPGGSVDRTVSIGNHTVSAVSVDTSVELSPTNVSVGSGGTRFTISCPVATSATLRVPLDSSCQGIVTSGVDIFLDGQLVGASFFGNPFTRSGVSFGTHTLAARERNLTLPNTQVNITTALFTFTLTCPR